MKRNLPLLVITGFAFLAWMTSAQAQCPEDPEDHGICDTLYVEVYECDWVFAGESKQVRVPIRITSDIENPVTDSIAGMVIPLCFTSTNPSANALLPTFCNTTYLPPYPAPMCECSIFRHLPDVYAPTESNWLYRYGAALLGEEWDTRILDLTTGETPPATHFWMSIVSTGTADKRFPGGSRLLTATLLFTVDDTTTICLDSCFWPPTGQLAFSRSDAETYIPRTNLPYCFSMSPPRVGDCTGDCIVDIGDVVYLINYLYLGGAPPYPVEVGDVNCDGIVDLADVVFLINYLFKGGPPPPC